MSCQQCHNLLCKCPPPVIVPVGLKWNAEKPAEKGVYVWKGSPAILALVLVHLRPSENAPGGVLKGSVLGATSSKFYDGCAIEEWDGEWIGPLPQ